MRKTKSKKIEKELKEIKELLKEISKKLDKMEGVVIHYHFDNRNNGWKSTTTWYSVYSPSLTTTNPEWCKICYN
jgi:predicted metallo-beta-lactamase superfamily hydrolase